MLWKDLTPDQQCVLMNAVEESYLFEVLNECGRGKDWPDRLPHVPRLAKIVQDFVDQGLVVLDRDAGVGLAPIDIPNDQVPAILGEPDNWWSPDGTRPIALAPTEAGLAVYRSTPSTPRDAGQQQSRQDPPTGGR
jgi:hypothetical protein